MKGFFFCKTCPCEYKVNNIFEHMSLELNVLTFFDSNMYVMSKVYKKISQDMLKYEVTSHKST